MAQHLQSITIHVGTEAGGEVVIGTETAWSGVPSNIKGALLWNGSAWLSNDTAAHMYFTRLDTGERLRNYTSIAIPTEAGTSSQNGIGFVAEEYSYRAAAADGSGTYQYTGMKYIITQADDKKIILLSRGLGRGTGAAYLEAFIENPTSGTLVIRDGSVLYSHTGTAAEAAALVNPSEGVMGLLRTDDVYWFDLNGGSDMGGVTYSPHTETLPGALVTAVHPEITNQVVRFDLMLMSAENVLYRYMLSPSLTSETFSGGVSSGDIGGSGVLGTADYTADVKESGVITDTLPVTVSGSTGAAGLGSVKAAALFDAGNASVSMPDIAGVSAYRLELPAAVLTANQEGGALTLETGFGSVTFSEQMLSSLMGASGKTAGITIACGDGSGLTDAEKAAVGNHPLIQLTLTLNGTQTEWNNTSAPVTVAIPYKPTAEELKNPESLIIWYLDGSGKLVCIPNGRYDKATGTVTFKATHFSQYAGGYNPVSFKDVAGGEWYHGAVSFIAARGITTGTGGWNYSPGAKLTRGEFIVLLMRAYEIAPDANPTINFADAGNTYYTNYLASAKRLGISAGVGGNMFVPGKEITRQEMFALLYNALNVIEQLPKGSSGMTLTDFSDAGQIDSWAKDSMTLLVETGTIYGSGGKLSPTATTLRAEMAQVLYNLLLKY
jgi:hypothetical protein